MELFKYHELYILQIGARCYAYTNQESLYKLVHMLTSDEAFEFGGLVINHQYTIVVDDGEPLPDGAIYLKDSPFA